MTDYTCVGERSPGIEGPMELFFEVNKFWVDTRDTSSPIGNFKNGSTT